MLSATVLLSVVSAQESVQISARGSVVNAVSFRTFRNVSSGRVDMVVAQGTIEIEQCTSKSRRLTNTRWRRA